MNIFELSFLYENSDLATEYDVTFLGIITLRNDLLIRKVKLRFHKHCQIHDFMLLRLFKYLECPHLVIVHELSYLVTHFRINKCKEVIWFKIHLIRVIDLVHVIEDFDFVVRSWNMMDLQAEVNEVKHSLKFRVLIHLLLHQCSEASHYYGYQECSDHQREWADKHF